MDFNINSLMTNQIFYGFMAHLLGGFAILLTIAFWSRNRKDMTIGWVILLAITAVKEFWYDVKFEIPPQDIPGGFRDFMGYQLGAAIAMVMGWIKLGRKKK
jgi:hypothetical protein